MEYWLSANPWPGVILWIMLYISDYYLTVYSARGLKEIGHFRTEGSFELTPQFQKDIDALKPVSQRHITLLVLYSLVMLGLWWLFDNLISFPWLYRFYLGMFLLIEVAVHIRHLRNVFIVREVKKNGGVAGQVTYQKWFSYKLSASDLFIFGSLFLMISLLEFSPFFFGGAIMCMGTAFKHNRMAKQARPISSPTVEAK